TADIDEKSIRRANPDELVMVLAEAKADAIISRIKSQGYVERIDAPTLLITSDIVCYSGGHVSTVGSVLVTNLKTGRRYGGLDKAEVYFHDIPDEIIENLIDEGVVFNVAGGLLLEHPLTLPFVEAVVSSLCKSIHSLAIISMWHSSFLVAVQVGTTDSVMGLAKALTEKLIREALLPDS
ncbi:hypothetical protein B296_00012915, partial [Ensete ventricosum]